MQSATDTTPVRPFCRRDLRLKGLLFIDAWSCIRIYLFATKMSSTHEVWFVERFTSDLRTSRAGTLMCLACGFIPCK